MKKKAENASNITETFRVYIWGGKKKKKREKEEEELDIKKIARKDKAVAVPLPLRNGNNTRTNTRRRNNTELPPTVMCTSVCWSRESECLKHTKDS